MGGTDTWSETGIHYKSKAAPFFRIGVDYNTMAKKKEKNSYLYAGIRYAFSSFKYDVSTLPADDPIWGDNIGNPSLGDDYWGGSIPFNHPGMKASVQWLEILGMCPATENINRTIWESLIPSFINYLFRI